ncbi:[Fe-Fe] hydrogenase large subunit C-terminal domain-containing protein [Thiospirochaeta perfilievii]|nr:[Fe-Fe] hydrogenase large subunit C-terminal domain-containing protein [Thiospirochaeta perfilievii]
MSKLNPIYTEITECNDCNKCIRECPVKSIKVKSGHAFIEPDLCILCGHCTRVCPRGAKKVRNDLDYVKSYLKENPNQRVIASVAPSYLSEYPGVTFEKLNTLFKKLGFYRAEETAIGAQIVSRYIDNNLLEGVTISSACPVTLSYIKKYRTELSKSILNVDSPLLAHCKELKSKEDCKIVFFGPCIGKKSEADNNPELLLSALTFKDLNKWTEDEEIILEDLEESFVPKRGTNGSFYPIEGGMIKSFKSKNDLRFSYSGIDSIVNSLDGISSHDKNLSGSFFELLACDGGCINGPGASCHSQTALKTIKVLEGASNKQENAKRDVSIVRDWRVDAITQLNFSEEEIRNVMRSVGKVKIEDEINCGACGYSTCREFALALLEGKAETNMCLNYLRKLSEQKANALIHTMPSGVIMVDNNLKIIESNSAFASLMGEDCSTIYKINEGLNGVSLDKILPQFRQFSQCLKSGANSESIIRVKDKIIKCIVYPVVDYLVVGGIFRDITETRSQREKIISKAQEVLTKNVSTVQQIAFLLGENAADSEVMLNSIIESFGKVDDDESSL